MNWIREVYLWYLFCCLYRQLVKHLRTSPFQTNTCTVMSPTTSKHGFTSLTGGYSNLSACPFAPLSTHVKRSPGERWAVILQLAWHSPPPPPTPPPLPFPPLTSAFRSPHQSIPLLTEPCSEPQPNSSMRGWHRILWLHLTALHAGCVSNDTLFLQYGTI